MRQRAGEDNLAKKKNCCQFLMHLSWYDHEFLHNIVKVFCRCTASLTMLWRNSWSITGRTHEKLTSICWIGNYNLLAAIAVNSSLTIILSYSRSCVARRVLPGRIIVVLVEAKRFCALLLLYFLAVKKKAVIVSFRWNTKVLSADRIADSTAVCNVFR